MVNSPVNYAHHIQGTDLQYLVEKKIRTRIYASKYWKEECFSLTAELLPTKAMDLRKTMYDYNNANGKNNYKTLETECCEIIKKKLVPQGKYMRKHLS
uniref:Pre-mRNA-splicing factor 38B n=1 Tax=Sarcophilus harrisii TaxID=9305 RepID=A0A7N4NFN4_SARHA